VIFESNRRIRSTIQLSSHATVGRSATPRSHPPDAQCSGAVSYPWDSFRIHRQCHWNANGPCGKCGEARLAENFHGMGECTLALRRLPYDYTKMILVIILHIALWYGIPLSHVSLGIHLFLEMSKSIAFNSPSLLALLPDTMG
jgi:hypothetical protein